MYSYCRVIGCKKPARAGTSDGLDMRFCKSHAEQYQRHGSPYKKSYTAKVLNPYRRAALAWITENEQQFSVKNAIQRVEGVYQRAGPHVEAFRLRGSNPRERAWAQHGHDCARPRSIPVYPSLLGSPWRWSSPMILKGIGIGSSSRSRPRRSSTGWPVAATSGGSDLPSGGRVALCLRGSH